MDDVIEEDAIMRHLLTLLKPKILNKSEQSLPVLSTPSMTHVL